MEWDKKTSSSCWDWDNVMLFSSRETEEGMKEMNSVYGSNSASGSSSGIPGVAPAAVTNSNNAGRGSASPSKDHQRPFSKEENNLLGRKPEEAKEPKQRDSLIDLKLGRRTDFEEDVSGKTMKSTTTMASSGPSKRPRSLMLKVQTPFCQVQGCNADLTSSKDYHKRHKVCEMHSKSSKARVAGLEQRFCQQCSRFHLLLEFDEGKRSCRKRLAGHNERRRKPQPDSLMSSARLLPSFHDNRRHGSILVDRSSFMYPGIVSSSMLGGASDFKLGHGNWSKVVKAQYQPTYDGHLQISGADQQLYLSTLPRHNTGRLLPFLHGPKSVHHDPLNHGTDQYTHRSRGSVCEALTLSSSSGTGVVSGLEVASAAQGLSGVSDSGCALSLLSSQSWSARAPGSASLDIATRSGITLDQLMHDNQPPMAQPSMQGLQSNFGIVADRLTSSSQSSTSLASSRFSATGINHVDEDQFGGVLVSNINGIGNFEGPVRGLLQGPNFRGSEGEISQDVRQTIDLMCMSSQSQTAKSQGRSETGHQGSGQFTDFQLMRPYESSFFDS